MNPGDGAGFASHLADDYAAHAALNSTDERETVKPGVFTLSSGIQVRVKPVSPMAIQAAVSKIPRPKVPTFKVPGEDREEENPDHPDYARALEEFNEAQAMASNNAALLLGTEIVDVPEGLQKPEDEGWLDDARWLGLLPESFDASDRRARYLAYMRIYGCRTHQDVAATFSAPLLMSGIGEGEVREAVEAFRSHQERASLERMESARPDRNGDRVPVRDGNGAAVRRDGGGAVQPLQLDRVDEPDETGTGDSNRTLQDASVD